MTNKKLDPYKETEFEENIYEEDDEDCYKSNEWYDRTFLGEYKSVLKRTNRKPIKVKQMNFKERIEAAKKGGGSKNIVDIMETCYYTPIRKCFHMKVSDETINQLLDALDLSETNKEILFKDVILKIQEYLIRDDKREKAYKGIECLSKCI